MREEDSAFWFVPQSCCFCQNPATPKSPGRLLLVPARQQSHLPGACGLLYKREESRIMKAQDKKAPPRFSLSNSWAASIASQKREVYSPQRQFTFYICMALALKSHWLRVEYSALPLLLLGCILDKCNPSCLWQFLRHWSMAILLNWIFPPFLNATPLTVFHLTWFWNPCQYSCFHWIHWFVYNFKKYGIRTRTTLRLQ